MGIGDWGLGIGDWGLGKLVAKIVDFPIFFITLHRK